MRRAVYNTCDGMIETLRSLYESAGHEWPMAPPSLRRSWQPQSLDDLDQWMDVTLPASGILTTRWQKVSTVWACINALSGDIAKLPLRTFRRDADDNRTLARDHYLYDLLRTQANPEMSAFRFKRLMMVWLLTDGNAYAEIEISGRGQVIALWPWNPAAVKVERLVENGPLTYTYRFKSGQTVTVPSSRILHLRGMECDGVMGISPLEAHRRRILLSEQQEQHNYDFYRRGGQIRGVLEHPGELGPSGKDMLRQSIDEQVGGMDNYYRLMILEEGMKFHETGVKQVDAQFLDSMMFGVEELARVYQVPPHRIGHLAKATNNNIEHQGREYVQYGIGAWGENWQQEIQSSLLSVREAQTIYTEFDYSELLKGDFKTEAEYIRSRWGTGSITADEIRRRSNENPLPDGMGKKPRVPLNTVWADQVVEPKGTTASESTEKSEQQPARYLNGHAMPELLLPGGSSDGKND